MTVGMSAPPMGTIMSTPKISGTMIITGKSWCAPGCDDEISGDGHRNREQRQIDEVLSLIGERTLRQDFLQFSRGHQTAGKGERAENHFHGENGHHEARNVGRAQIEFGGADEGDAECAESVAERGPLRDGGHVHHAQRNADAGAEHEGDGDPLVVDDTVMQQGAGDGQDHADFAGPDAAPGGGRTCSSISARE